MFDFEGSPFRVFFYANGESQGRFSLSFIPRVGDILNIPVRMEWYPTGERITLRVTEVEIILHEPDSNVLIDVFVSGMRVAPR